VPVQAACPPTADAGATFRAVVAPGASNNARFRATSVASPIGINSHTYQGKRGNDDGCDPALAAGPARPPPPE